MAIGDKRLCGNFCTIVLIFIFIEIKYHLRYSSEWTVRLGDGTEESHTKMQNALDDLWMYSGELCTPDALDEEMAGKQGQHSEHLGFILAEMQFMQRAYPGAEW